MGPAFLMIHEWQSKFLSELMSGEPGRLMSPIKRKRIPDSVFYWDTPGHDPYNHHGCFMLPMNVDWSQVERRVLVWLDDYAPSHDPYNHVGRYA